MVYYSMIKILLLLGVIMVSVVDCALAQSTATRPDQFLAGNNAYTGTNYTTTATASGTSNIDLSGTGLICGKPLLYTGGSAGTLTILSTAVAGCAVPVTATSTGLVTIAVSGGSFHSNTACAANPRTKESGSTIFILIQSNPGSAPVVNISGDCG